MIPVKLKLSNFTSYAQNPPELDFTKFKLAAISGLNGAGKSSLLDALTWCVWGVSRAGDSSDALVHSGADDMFVEFSFELDGHNYTVKRRRLKKGGGTTALELWSGNPSTSLRLRGRSDSRSLGHNLTEGTIKATQEKIIALLHLSFETFTNSSYLRQGHADEFTTKGPTDRKRILADILGLDHYDLLEEKAKEKIKEIHSKLQLLEYQVLEIEAELTQKEERSEKKKTAEETIIKLESQIKILEEKLKTLREQKETLNIACEQRKKLEQDYSQNKKELEEIVKQGKSRKEKIEIFTKKLEELKGVEEKLKKLRSLQLEKEKLDETRQKKLVAERQISEIQGRINLKKQQSEQIQKEIDKLSLQMKESDKPKAKCPTCGQDIDKEEKAHVFTELTSQITGLEKTLKKIDFSKEKKEVTDLENKLSSLQFDPQKYQDISHQLSDLEKLQEQKEQCLKIQAALNSEQKVVLEMRTLYQNKHKQVEEQKSEMEKYPDLSAKLAESNREISQTENQLQIIRGEESKAQGALGQINELISRTAQLEKAQQQKTGEKTSLQKEKEMYEDLALAFGKKGIQTMIIEAAIPEIEDETNKLLEKLTEGRMKVALVTQRETKTKLADGERGIVETLDIIISDEMGERLYENFSGGEQFRVNFAIRLAISKLLTHRAGAKLQFLVIDEGFGSQDAPGRARLVEAIDAIKDDFEKIVVITHIEELKEEFPVRIEVSKNALGSTFEVVGV